MADLTDRFETAEEILALSNETLGGFLLETLETIRKSEPGHAFSLGGICRSIVEQYAKKGFGRTTDLSRAIAEAWTWLLVEGHLAFDPYQSGDFCFVTRRGMKCSTHEGVEEYRKRRLLSSDLLNKTIREESFADYLAGDFESAILKAFRKIEIEVRSACGNPANVTAVPLVRQAFQSEPNAGPLSLSAEPGGDQQAMAHLFAGAMGRFRNPAAHGSRAFSDPIEAAQLLLFASHLMDIVHERRPLGG